MRFLLPLILLSTLTNNAFATHAYRSENCASVTHTLNYNGNYPVGGMYGIKKVEQDNQDELPALPLFDMETPTTLEDAEVVFNELTSKVVKTGTSSKDCGFDHEEWTSEKTIEISLISKEASFKLGLKQGDKMTMICEESTDFPNGSDCE